MKISRYIVPKFRYNNIIQSQRISNMSNTIDYENLPLNHIKITEGSAHMYYDKKEAVFYNKVQVLNRDISIQVIKLFSEIYDKEKLDKYTNKMIKYNSGTTKIFDHAPIHPLGGISILDALAATGLRSIRYVKEIPLVRKVTINDLSKDATDVATNNIRLNNVDITKCEVTNRDATMLMYENRNDNKNFDVIDLDPYGSASEFLDSAVQSVANGGLLCVTCTDMTSLAGTFPGKCFAKYGSIPLKASYRHEMSLRILLHAIESTANKYKRYIVPWLSLSVDFYVRVFVRVYESPAEVRKSCLKRFMSYQSTQSPNFHIQPIATQKSHCNLLNEEADQNDNKKEDLSFSASPASVGETCPESGSSWKIGGPFWGHPIHKQDIVDELLERVVKVWKPEKNTTEENISSISTAPRLAGLLTTISEELKDSPFYFLLPDLASTLGIRTPPRMEFQSALINAGYRVSQFHHEPNAIKTNAPNYVVWDIMRAYSKKFPPLATNTSVVATKILSKECVTNVNFTTVRSNKPYMKQMKISRFPSNPEPNWGPKSRAGRKEKHVVPVVTTNSTTTNIANSDVDKITNNHQDHKRMKTSPIESKTTDV